MSVEFLLGPAGSGKTIRCLEQVRDALQRDPDGPPLLFLAPKQATYQIERRLLVDLGLPGFNRLQIVSFDRLALYLLDFFGLSMPEALSEEGRAMVIRSLLLRHGHSLGAFGASARGAGFARALSGWLRELQQHGGNPAKLREIAAQSDTPPALRAKIADAALILDHYLGWLVERGINDPDLALPLAVETLGDGLRELPMLPIGWVWLDGFAELTPAEMDLLEVVVRASQGATLAFCLPRSRLDGNFGFDLWCNIGETFRACHARLSSTTKEPIQLRSLPDDLFHTRFATNPILSHLEAQLGTTVARPNDAADDLIEQHLQLWHCPHPDAEAELVARVVLEYVQNGGRFREVGIVLRTLQGYATAFSRVFRRHGIPLFIDQRAAIGHHPAIELIRASFRVLTRNWAPADVFAILKTGLAIQDSSQADRLENAALKAGWEKERWHAPIDPEMGGEIAATRSRVVEPLLVFTRAVGNEPDGNTIAAAIAQLLRAWDVEKQLDAWHLASPESPHSTVWKALESWQENVRLAFAHDSLPLAEWAEVFESGLSGLSVGVLPPALDQVLLGTVDRSRNPELRIVFVPGLNEGIFPARPPAPQILGQQETLWLETKGLGRSGASLQRMAHERFFGYIALTRSNDRVIASWSASDSQGGSLEPSPLVRQIQHAFPNLSVREFAEPSPVEFRHPVQWLFSDYPSPPFASPATIEIIAAPLFQRAVEAGWHAAAPEDQLRPEIALELYGPSFRFSPSRLETFASCPFQYFALHGLRCSERPLFEADARDRGSFEHAVLATFHRQIVRQGKRWRDLSASEINQGISEAVQSELQANERASFAGSPAALYRTESIRVRLAKLVARLVGGMISHRFDPENVEVQVTLPIPDGTDPSGPAIEISGRLDRIDTARDSETGAEYVLVADYKSRGRSFDKEGLYLGSDIQAPLYAAAFLAEGGGNAGRRPAGWVWVPLRNKADRSGRRNVEEAEKTGAWLRGRLGMSALGSFKSGPDDASPFAIKLKKDGQPSALSDMRPDDELTGLLQDALLIAHGIARMIIGGLAVPSPLLHKGELACEYCRAREICRFEPQISAPRNTPIFPLVKAD